MRLAPFLLIQAVLLAPFVACSQPPAPPATAPTTLATLGPQVTLTASVSPGDLHVTLDTSDLDDPCPVVAVQATANGQSMTVTSDGSGTTEPYGDGFGCGGGPYTHVCNPPSFDAPFDPSSTSDLQITLQDASATYVFHAQVARYAVAFEPPYDGVLHVGSWSSLSISPGPPPLSEPPVLSTLDFFSGSAPATSSPPLFALSFPWGESCVPNDGGDGEEACDVTTTPTGISFLVPDVPPQSGTLQLQQLPPGTTLECTGPSRCALDVSTPVPSLATAIGP